MTRHHTPRPTTRHAFTLIELLVVMAMIAMTTRSSIRVNACRVVGRGVWCRVIPDQPLRGRKRGGQRGVRSPPSDPERLHARESDSDRFTQSSAKLPRPKRD